MPLYAYKCDGCKQQIDQFRSIDDRYKPVACPECHCYLRRDFLGEQTNSPMDEFWRPIISDSMSVGADPRDIADHKRRHPDIQITEAGQPILTSRKEKLDYMRKEGWEERS